MKDKSKTKEQLGAELAQMRQRIAELEAAEAERSQTEEALRVSETEKGAILNAMSDIVLFQDTNLSIRWGNEAAGRSVGKTQQELVGCYCYELWHGRSDPCERCPVLEALETGLHADNIMMTPDRRWWEVIGEPVRDRNEKIVGAIEIAHDITERRRADREIKERHMYLEAVLGAAPDAIVTLDAHHRIVEWNLGAERLFGYSQQEVMGQNLDHLITNPDTLEEAIGLTQIIMSGKDVPPVETVRYHKDGSPVNVTVAGSPILAGDELIGVVAVYTDITARKRAEEALRQRNRELTMVNRVSRTLGSTLDLDQILATVLEEVRRLLDVVACSVWLKDAQGDLVCRQVIGPQSEIVRGWRLAPGKGLAGWVALSGESLIVPDVRADERYFEAVDQQTGLGLRSILSLPLRIKQNVIGVIQVVDTEIERFSPADLTLLEPLAMTAAAAIENARLYEQAQRDAETRATLLREVNHRVKNNLTAVMGMLALEMQRPHRESADLQTILRDLQDRIRGLVTVHDLLSAAQWSPLPLDRLVTEVIRATLNSSPIRHKIKVSIRPAAEPLSITPYQATGLALVVNELTTNSIKHVFSGRSQGGHIDVQITTGQDDRDVTLRFRDDGPGWPDDVLRGAHEDVGLNIIRMTVRSPLRGQLALSNDGGAVATITFRLAPTGPQSPGG